MNPQECLQNQFWEKYIEKGLIVAIKLVNIFYNNKQNILSDEVWKNTVERLKKKKKRQKSKENPF